MADQRLILGMQQGLVMTPQLRMAIKLLQMNTLDIQHFVAQELLENPFLQPEEYSQKADEREPTSTEEGYDEEAIPQDFSDDVGLDVGWDSMYETGAPATSNYNTEDQQDAWERTATTQETLKDHLTEQLTLTTVDATERFLGQLLIDAIDDAGYISLDFSTIAGQLGVEVTRLFDVLTLIQSFDPIGVGARNLAECLKLQLADQGALCPVAEVVLANLDILARQDIAKLAKIAGCSSEQAQEVCTRITKLTPKPGLKFGAELSQAVVPELMAYQVADGAWRVELNAEAMPKILVQGHNMASFRKDEKAYATEKMNRAQWLLKSLEQRARTIYKVGQAILELQKGFFDHGVEYLQPLTLKTVADKIDVHESTVSRVTSGKYIQTPMGVFELKYFFSSGIGTMGGKVEVAAESVKAMIQRHIKAEDSTKPLSDESLVKALKTEGVDVARRTVAKYREALGIPSSARRRVRV